MSAASTPGSAARSLRARLFGRGGDPWDLPALLNAADPRATRAERHLWLVRLMEWLRHVPRRAAAGATPVPVLRLKHLLNVLEQNPEHGERVAALLRAFWRELRVAGLFADFGFGPRLALLIEVRERLLEQWLPATPDTAELAELFGLLFRPEDADWIRAIDDATLARLGAPGWRGRDEQAWRVQLLDALSYLVAAISAFGFSGVLRKRMAAQALADDPFRQLAVAAEELRQALLAEPADAALLRQRATFLRALFARCRSAVDTIADHLEEFGVSVDIVYAADQLIGRIDRSEQLLDTLLADAPGQELRRLVVALVEALGQRRRIRALLAQHYAQLARKMAERSAETGEHYIARTRDEYRAMLRRAAGGGAVMAATTFLKFGIGAIGLHAFWTGVWYGANYATSFVLIMLAHWTVATKQPAMTAPAMAQRLGDVSTPAKVEAFVDDVAHLLRSQAAGVFGNVGAVAPLVLLGQLLWIALSGRPLVGAEQAEHVLHSLTLLGPTALFAAFTGVLLFVSSLLAGWVENWFVLHRLDSALAWNPAVVARLGAGRAQRWAGWWRHNISAVTSNVSLGLMLGLLPPVLDFFGLPLDVRHVTLSAGQLGAAAGALGTAVLREPAFWWCLAGLAVTGLLNVSVSFWLALKLAANARGVRRADRRRIAAALRQRLRQRPTSFLWAR